MKISQCEAFSAVAQAAYQTKKQDVRLTRSQAYSLHPLFFRTSLLHSTFPVAWSTIPMAVFGARGCISQYVIDSAEFKVVGIDVSSESSITAQRSDDALEYGGLDTRAG